MNSSITITLPCETNSTNSVMRRPRPVSVIAPTTTPAVAVATPMPIMLREPSTKPCTTSWKPCVQAPGVRVPRTKSNSGRCVTISRQSTTIAQNADSDGESSSIIRHQISTPIGSRKCSPALTVGQVSSAFGLSMSMSEGRSGLFAAIHVENRYRPRTNRPMTHCAPSPRKRLASSRIQ